jgi:putative ABC transport system ATP-binding protein
MESSIFRYILRYSLREQIMLLVFTGISFPFLYYSLDLPKTIINKALRVEEFRPTEFLGIQFTDHLVYLFTLCGMFLLLVFINGGFKYFINTFKGRLGERMLRRLRYELYARVLRFPLPHFRRVSQGEIIPMITSEVEPLGGFIGDSIALPAFQGGTLLTIIVFMFVQDWVLGLAAVALYPLQGYFIPKLQAKVNALGKQRVRTVRRLADRIGETISGVQEVHANDGARHRLAVFAEFLGRIYDIRFEIYQRKFFIKFLNNFLAQLTPFFFYAIGGYLVITGGLTIGALVAVLAAYKDLSSPWKELLNYYQMKEDARIKYEQVVEQFDPPGTMAEDMQFAEVPPGTRLDGEIQASNLGLHDEEAQPLFEGVNLKLQPGERMAVVGPGGGGKDVLGTVLGRLILPTAGQLSIGGQDLSKLPESITGRRIGYVGPAAFVFATSVRENLLLGAMHMPQKPVELDAAASAARESRMAGNAASGNSMDDLTYEWVDCDAVGVASRQELDGRIGALLKTLELEADVYGFGLRGTIDPKARPEIAEFVLEARHKLRDRLSQPELAGLVESFDAERYNSNATVAENLLFGTPRDDRFNPDQLGQNRHVRAVLDKAGLTDDFTRIGRDVAATMVELFADLPSDHEFFAQYSFISSEDLPEFQVLIGRAERLGLERMDPADRERFLALPFKLIIARHRLGLLDEALQARILDARRILAADLPDDMRDALEFFSDDRYNAAASLQDNILFGKIAFGQANAADRVGALIAEVIESEGLRAAVVQVGLDFEAGIAGSRLSAAQRQKVGMARVLLRRPDVLILNEAFAALDSGSQGAVIDGVLREMDGRAVIAVLNRPSQAVRFGRVAVMRGGRMVEEGVWADLNKDGTALRALLDQE